MLDLACMPIGNHWSVVDGATNDQQKATVATCAAAQSAGAAEAE